MIMRTGMMPMGFNYMPSYYTERDIYWKNHNPVNPETWPYFKRLQENEGNLMFFMDKPLGISVDFIMETFNSVHHVLTNAVLRDPIFQFHSFLDNLNIPPHWLYLSWDDNSRTFILHLPTHEYKTPLL